MRIPFSIWILNEVYIYIYHERNYEWVMVRTVIWPYEKWLNSLESHTCKLIRLGGLLTAGLLKASRGRIIGKVRWVGQSGVVIIMRGWLRDGWRKSSSSSSIASRRKRRGNFKSLGRKETEIDPSPTTEMNLWKTTLRKSMMLREKKLSRGMVGQGAKNLCHTLSKTLRNDHNEDKS